MYLLLTTSICVSTFARVLTSSHAFTFTSTSSRCFVWLSQQKLYPTSTNSVSRLDMVGFKDPREEEDEKLFQMGSEYRKELFQVKKWLYHLMGETASRGTDTRTTPQSEDRTVALETATAVPSEEIGLLGGGEMASVASQSTTTLDNTPTYRPNLRSSLGKTVLLTGTYDSALLRVLNNNFFGSRDGTGGGASGDSIPNFDFDKILLLVKGEEGVAEVKKKVISREARYSGLLDKVVIQPIGHESANSGSSNSEATSMTVLPSKDEMSNVSSWIIKLASLNEASDLIPKMAALAKECPTLKHVVVMVEGLTSVTTTQPIDGWDSLLRASHEEVSSFQCTLLAVGELYDQGNEGNFFHIGKLGEIPSPVALAKETAPPKILRSEAYTILANLLALESSSNQELMLYEYSPSMNEVVTFPIKEKDESKEWRDGELIESKSVSFEEDEWKDLKYESRIIRGMREMGFSRLAELDVLLNQGVSGYIEYKNAPPQPIPMSGLSIDSEDEMDKKIMAELNELSSQNEAKLTAEKVQKEKEDIDRIARDWAIRQYTLRSLNDEIDSSMLEKDFIESIWDEALEEGKKLYTIITSKEYEKEMKQKKRDEKNFDKLFYEGMDPKERKKRELIVNRVKNQYLGLFGEEELKEILAGIDEDD